MIVVAHCFDRSFSWQESKFEFADIVIWDSFDYKHDFKVRRLKGDHNGFGRYQEDV